jgi:imidazolonepropionase-like amidohydrolase
VVAAGGGGAGALLISGGEILAELEPGLDWPEGLEVRDLAGAAVIPGLIDSHVHLYHSGATWWVGDTVADNLRATLYWGVTGVMDVGAPEVIFGLRDRVARGELLGPRIAATGPFITAEGSHPCETGYDRDLCVFVDGDGAAQADALRAAGADWIKVGLADNSFTDDPTPRLDLADLADVSAGETPVTAHIAQAADASDALAAGVTSLAHTVFAEPVSPEVAALPFLAVSSTWMATRGVAEIVEGADLDGPDYAALPREVEVAWAYIQSHPEVLAEGWAEDSAGWAEQALENLAVYREAGAPIVAGSDAGYYFVAHGGALHSELEALVASGWSEVEALAAATSAPAAALGWDDAGWLGAGYRADLVVLDGDPLADIADTRQILAVVLGGQWWTPTDLLEADLWRAAGEGFCLDDRDCGGGGVCDRVDHACVLDCEVPYTYAGECDEESWCAPADGLSTTADGVCHVEEGCDWRTQDCAPASYAETCVPADVDTSYCWPSGEQDLFETCSYSDPALRCAPGLFCSWVDGRCYELCDPDGEDACSVGRCNQQFAAPGTPWFGLCY